ncbi:hypothetical protein [Crystallibacter crystallopoietes]|uniref:hypothetical protein n=1 Tax=Crystallibacter crystallopoietes TaxID=37928 RepID=UPI0002E80ACA|nr:hypothetical protein [Arthrobacter crystallopoietes]
MREGQLAELFEQAGLRGIEEERLTVTVAFEGFADWWEPYTLGVGPAGEYLRGLDAGRRREVMDRCAALLPDGAFELAPSAWFVRGHA